MDSRKGQKLSSSKNIGVSFPVIRRLGPESELLPSSTGCKMCARIILCPRKSIISQRA